jgi:hypothetical protein
MDANQSLGWLIAAETYARRSPRSTVLESNSLNHLRSHVPRIGRYRLWFTEL